MTRGLNKVDVVQQHYLHFHSLVNNNIWKGSSPLGVPQLHVRDGPAALRGGKQGASRRRKLHLRGRLTTANVRAAPSTTAQVSSNAVDTVTPPPDARLRLLLTGTSKTALRRHSDNQPGECFREEIRIQKDLSE